MMDVGMHQVSNLLHPNHKLLCLLFYHSNHHPKYKMKYHIWSQEHTPLVLKELTSHFVKRDSSPEAVDIEDELVVEIQSPPSQAQSSIKLALSQNPSPCIFCWVVSLTVVKYVQRYTYNPVRIWTGTDRSTWFDGWKCRFWRGKYSRKVKIC